MHICSCGVCVRQSATANCTHKYAHTLCAARDGAIIYELGARAAREMRAHGFNRRNVQICCVAIGVRECAHNIVHTHTRRAAPRKKYMVHAEYKWCLYADARARIASQNRVVYIWRAKCAYTKSTLNVCARAHAPGAAVRCERASVVHIQMYTCIVVCMRICIRDEFDFYFGR